MNSSLPTTNYLPTGQAGKLPTVSAIVPAYNEEKNIGRVIEALKKSSLLSEIIVVDDGSTDATARIAATHGVYVISEKNSGKAAAMVAGAVHTAADILFFADADLLGFGPEHIEALLKPVIEKRAGMTVGIRDRGRVGVWMMEHVLPIIGGERAVPRDIFLRMSRHNAAHHFGIEIVMNAYCHLRHLPVKLIRMRGVTPIIKERKYGLWKGLKARAMMIVQILSAELAVLFDHTYD